MGESSSNSSSMEKKKKKITKNREMEMEAGAFSNKLEENLEFPLTTPYRTGQVIA